jgi:hypothetical protein
VGVEVDGQADLLPQGADQPPGRFGLADTGHVFDAQHVGSGLFELLGQADVVAEVVATPGRLGEVAGVTDGRLADLARLPDSLDGHPHVLHPVQRVEDAEDVDARGG